MITTRRVLFSALMALCVTGTTPALAQSGKNGFGGLITAPDFNPADKTRIAKGTAYLQNLSGGSGRFTQTDYRGKTTQGNWYLQRPGKIRFEYDAPYSLLIVSNGTTVNMWDPRLQTFNSYPLNETPLSLFLARQIRLDQGVIVTGVSSNVQGFQLKARDRRKQVEGSITLGFNQAPDGSVALREWTVVDGQGRATKVELTSFKVDSAFSPGTFVLTKPQSKK